jgi:predicted O-methyltransferase YrrM
MTAVKRADSAMKALRLLSLLLRHPAEFYDRLAAIIAVRLESTGDKRPVYRIADMDSAIRALETYAGPPWSFWFSEPALADVGERVREEQARIPSDAPFGAFHNGDLVLSRFCYGVTRVLRPKVVIETGVCYGVTSAHVLQALYLNKQGYLHSIDLPPLGKNADAYVGRFVPADLRSRWILHRGTSRRLLPFILKQVPSVDLFIHDSLHTYGNMSMEFAIAWPALARGGILISDDVQGNAAFLELSQNKDVSHSIVINTRDNQSLLGVAVKSK